LDVPLPWEILPPVIVARLKSANITTVEDWQAQRSNLFGITKSMQLEVDCGIRAAMAVKKPP
jgi:hypothetical protein